MLVGDLFLVSDNNVDLMAVSNMNGGPNDPPPVSLADQYRTQVEVAAATDPNDPNRMAALSFHFIAQPGDEQELALFTTDDRSQSWTTRFIGRTGVGNIDDTDGGALVMGGRFDPALPYDAYGNLFIAYGAGAILPNKTFEEIVRVGRSSDNGASFQFTTAVDSGNANLDKFVIATGRDPLDAN